ncbi:hypothetical protein C8Q77DRAFT_306985 [Trametes polyzona]|nr:hypothetical protein C8Q77DRAFT_306985 [Trametes polyzona]
MLTAVVGEFERVRSERPVRFCVSLQFLNPLLLLLLLPSASRLWNCADRAARRRLETLRPPKPFSLCIVWRTILISGGPCTNGDRSANRTEVAHEQQKLRRHGASRRHLQPPVSPALGRYTIRGGRKARGVRWRSSTFGLRANANAAAPGRARARRSRVPCDGRR